MLFAIPVIFLGMSAKIAFACMSVACFGTASYWAWRRERHFRNEQEIESCRIRSVESAPVVSLAYSYASATNFDQKLRAPFVLMATRNSPAFKVKIHDVRYNGYVAQFDELAVVDSTPHTIGAKMRNDDGVSLQTYRDAFALTFSSLGKHGMELAEWQSKMKSGSFPIVVTWQGVHADRFSASHTLRYDEMGNVELMCDKPIAPS